MLARQQNIYLVGLMGAGKSTAGRALARKLNKKFFDSDAEIEARCGVSVAMIFDLEGEEGFRKREAKIISELTKHQEIVLATGGGTIMSDENKLRLQQNGIIIYLSMPPNELWTRLRYDRKRPLMQSADPQSTLKMLYEQRDPVYREMADFVIEVDSSGLDSLISKITEKIE